VTHDELRTLLPRYSAGELDEADALVIRDHLQTGCTECLEAVFRRDAAPSPARAVSELAAETVVAPRVAAPRRPFLLWLIGLGVLLLLLAAAVALLAARERERRADAARSAADLQQARAELEGARRELESRSAAAAAAQSAAESEARRQAEAAQANAAASADLAHRLASAEARIEELSRDVRKREVEIGRLLAGTEVRALGDLAATPGVAVLRLAPAPIAAGARGHVLWHPARERIVLYVFDLPEGRYRSRVHFDNGVVAAGPFLRLDKHGEAATVIELGVRAARMRAVEVAREPGEDRVLEGRLP
jgi:multidrug efflux pump subunit AcrA (membrane-fusion protein)